MMSVMGTPASTIDHVATLLAIYGGTVTELNSYDSGREVVCEDDQARYPSSANPLRATTADEQRTTEVAEVDSGSDSSLDGGRAATSCAALGGRSDCAGGVRHQWC